MLSFISGHIGIVAEALRLQIDNADAHLVGLRDDV